MNQITGRAISGMHGMKELMMPALGTELIYSIVIIACSLMIYFGTKELYELSYHKGIKYFREAFLLFAIAYFFRYSIKFILQYFNVGMILDMQKKISQFYFGQITLFIFIYFSSMAIFYLLYSVIWKKLNHKTIYISHAVAILFATLTILSRNPLTQLTINILLFFIALLTVYIADKSQKKKTKHSLYTIYVLLSFFWILNILEILIPHFLQSIQILIYIPSTIIFLIILYKVLKKTG